MQNLIHLIRPDNFVDEVLAVSKPILLLCMPSDDDFPSQLRLMEDIAQHHRSWLKVGMLAEAFTEYFKNKLDIPGTPTFLILLQGKEKNRMLGLVDLQALENFILETLRQEDVSAAAGLPTHSV
jgi:hypothetical protein